MFNHIQLRLWLALALLVVGVGASFVYRSIVAPFNLTPYMAQVDGALAQEDWARADTVLQELEARWQRARPIVELNYGSDLLDEGERTLKRLEGGIKSRDATAARIELSDLQGLWQSLMTAIPDGK